MSDTVFFAAPVLRHETGMKMHYVPIPPEVFAALGEPRIVVGSVNGVGVRRAVQSRRARPHLALGRRVLKDMGLAYGDTAEIELMPAPDPDAVHLPEELVVALAQDAEAAARFETFTPGRQRSMGIYVEQARRPATREKRALELARKIRTHTLYGDQNR